jgi:hypothetical protein
VSLTTAATAAKPTRARRQAPPDLRKATPSRDKERHRKTTVTGRREKRQEECGSAGGGVKKAVRLLGVTAGGWSSASCRPRAAARAGGSARRCGELSPRPGRAGGGSAARHGGLTRESAAVVVSAGALFLGRDCQCAPARERQMARGLRGGLSRELALLPGSSKCTRNVSTPLRRALRQRGYARTRTVMACRCPAPALR